jgi:hypothetical protein
MEEEVIMLSIKAFRIPGKLITGSGSSEQVGEESKKLGYGYIHSPTVDGRAQIQQRKR